MHLLPLARVAAQLARPAARPAAFVAGFTLVEIMVVVVVVGLLALLALPALKKVREASQDRAVFNNARQLAAAADQYFLESGASFAGTAELVGSTNYVKTLTTVANEVYPDFYTHGVTVTITNVGGARTVTFTP